MADARRLRNKKAAPDAAAVLRRQAEERLKELSDDAAPVPDELAAAVHELRVHQIELEMQNEELRHAQLELETSREKYVELFHLAPVGYFTLSEKGIVGEANSTAAQMLGVARRQLVGQPFSAFVFAADRRAYYRHLELIVKTSVRQTCELRLQPVGGEPFWAQLDGQPQGAAHGEPPGYRLTFTNVHERVLAAEVLRQSQEQLASAVDGSGVGLWDWCPQTGEETLSERWAEILGYTLAELAPTSIETWRDLCHPGDLRRADELLEEHFAGHSGIYACETRMRHKDGHWVWVLDQGKVSQWDSDGRPLRMIGTELDISARKRAEEALREASLYARNLIETSLDPLVTISAEGRITDVNAATENITGRGREALIGSDFADYFTEPEAARAGYLQAFAAGQVIDYPLAIRHSSGSITEVLYNASVYRDAQGEVLGVFAAARDVTARKRAEEALRESEERHRAMFEKNGAIKLVIDPKTAAIVDANPAACEFYGYSFDELLARKITDINTAPESTVRKEMARSASKRVRSFIFQHRLASGELRDVEVNSGPFETGGRTLLFSVINDITERRQTEEQIQQRNQELARLNEELVAEAAALAEANATITRIAATDDLTGLASRRHFYEALAQAISLARRHGSPLALVSFDLDGLKRVNDTLGHEAGDEVLTSFAELLGALCRAEDVPARLGGDEFSVLLPGVELDGARGLAERLLAGVRVSAALEKRAVTVSAGVVQWSPDELPDDLLRRADEALYAAKREGGDVVASDSRG